MAQTLTALTAALVAFAERPEFVQIGIKKSFGLRNLGALETDDNTPPKLPPELYPCAIAMPYASEQIVYQSHAAMGNVAEVPVTMSQLWVIAPADADTPIYKASPYMMQLIDVHMAVLKVYPFMSDASAPALVRAPQVTYEMSVIDLSSLGLDAQEFHTVLTLINTVIVP